MAKIDFVHQNIMTVDGAYLRLSRAKSMRDHFAELIQQSRPLIVNQLEQLYTETTEANPDDQVTIGSVWLGRLAIGTNAIDAALTESGLYQRYKTQRNRGVYTDPANFEPGFILGYWQAIAINGLKPEVRQSGGYKLKDGLHLLATLDDEF